MPDAGRVIAGRARGIRLAGPGGDTRVLGDRVKQTLFAILEPDLPDARVLDLFAGSGAAGIEALSRRAGDVTFVERDPAAIRTIHANLDKAHLSGPGVRTVGTDVRRWLADSARASEPPYDIVIVDPPYKDDELMAAALEAVEPLVRAGGRVVAKHATQTPPPAVVGLLASERERRFGETTLTFYRRSEGP
jgi:16S rRNA (guanine(966)-N(2))-methyltransferase RsmD